MKKINILLTAICLVAVTAFAQDRPVHPAPTPEQSTRYGWATVLRSDPVYAQSDEPAAAQNNCREGTSSLPPSGEPVRGEIRAGGTMVGAIIGGVVGSFFGKGDGRKATTAVGVIAGGVIGNQVAAASDANLGPGDAGVDPPQAAVAGESGCIGVQSHKRIVAYDVEYRYAGELYIARLAYDPGDRMRVKISVLPAD